MKAKIRILGSGIGYDLAARDYDSREKYLNSFEGDKLRVLIGDTKGLDVLDAGAGTGRVSIDLARQGAKVTALDISPKMLKILKKKEPRIKTVEGDVEALPFAAESFDLVVAAFLIVHLSDPKRFFDEAYRVLKDGGRLIVTNINQKEPPEIKTEIGTIKIESYYHRPDAIINILESLAYTIDKDLRVTEKEVWVNQIVVAKK